MAETGRKVEVRLGAFSCSVEGYDDPVEQIREVLLLLQQTIRETPELSDRAVGETELARIETALDQRPGAAPGITVIRPGPGLQAPGGIEDAVTAGEPTPAPGSAVPFANIFAAPLAGGAAPAASIFAPPAMDAGEAGAAISVFTPPHAEEPSADAGAYSDQVDPDLRRHPREDEDLSGLPGNPHAERNIAGAATQPEMIDDDPTTDAAPEAGPASSPAALAARAGARSVPELLAVAAAWATLVDGKRHFSRGELMEIFECLPGDHPHTLEARMKGFGELVRSGAVLVLDEGAFTLSPSRRDRFRALLDTRTNGA